MSENQAENLDAIIKTHTDPVWDNMSLMLNAAQEMERRYEELREAHNRHATMLNTVDTNFNKADEYLLQMRVSLDELRDTYNQHLLRHERDEEHASHLTHVINENFSEQRQQHWLIVGAIALAAFALGRKS